MPASPEQVAANRRNASKSTGPRTPEGKAVTRFNAVKHGLRAESTLLPGEDAEHVRKRFVNLHKEMGPTRELTEALVDRIALLTIRLERCGRFDTAHYSDRVRDAVEGFDDARRSRVEILAGAIGFDTSACRKLQAMPEGVDWMLGEWQKLRDDLDRPEGMLWSIGHLERTRDLRGVAGSKVRASRDWILTEMVRDFFGNESMIDVPPGLDVPGKVAWALEELLKIVDAEMARLTTLRESFDPAVLAEIRAKSVDLALFDPSKELTLARKYEAAAERSLYKAIKEFREAEAEPVAPDPEAINPESGETSGELGSFDPIGDPEFDGRSTAIDPSDPIASAASIRAENGPDPATGGGEIGRSGPA